MRGAMPPFSNTPSRLGIQLRKSQGQFYVYFLMATVIRYLAVLSIVRYEVYNAVKIKDKASRL
jgi:hypothetical protein